MFGKHASQGIHGFWVGDNEFWVCYKLDSSDGRETDDAWNASRKKYQLLSGKR